MNPPSKLIYQEMCSCATTILPISQDQSIENNTKRIMTHLLKHWGGKNSSVHPSANALTPTEVVALKVYSIKLK